MAHGESGRGKRAALPLRRVLVNGRSHYRARVGTKKTRLKRWPLPLPEGVHAYTVSLTFQ